jgi:tetratricopeptide (TPR) repeat protein
VTAGSRRRTTLLALLLLAVAGALSTAPALASSAPVGFVILPFENTSEAAALDWLQNGLAFHTGEHLKACGAAVVEEEDRAVFLEGNGIPPGASLTLASALELGRKMRARSTGLRPDRLVLGRFSVQEGDVTVQIRVIDLEAERARPWQQRQGRLIDLLAVHAGLMEGLGHDAGVRGCGGGETDPAPPLLAFETYTRAMAESEPKKRLGLLKRALQEFPGYPQAAYQTSVLLARAERWDEAAQTLQSMTKEPIPYATESHLLAASVALQRQDATTAATQARLALQRAPSARGHALLGRAQAAQGDLPGARKELERAQAIDPSETEVEDLKRVLDGGAPAGGKTQ